MRIKGMSKNIYQNLDQGQISHIVELAWADEVSFNDIEKDVGLSEPQVIEIMRQHLKPSSFRMWRKRVSGRTTKHQNLMRDDKGNDFDPRDYLDC